MVPAFKRSLFSDKHKIEIMIILIHSENKELTQEMYDKLILQLFNDRTSIKSPSCEDGQLEKHAYYKRGCKSLNGKDETVQTILR